MSGILGSIPALVSFLFLRGILFFPFFFVFWCGSDVSIFENMIVTPIWWRDSEVHGPIRIP